MKTLIGMINVSTVAPTYLEIVLCTIDFCILSKNEKNSHLIHFTSAHHKKYMIWKEAEKRVINTKTFSLV